MTTTASPLVGRDEQLGALLDAASSGRHAVLVAAPGMGKTSVMRAVVAGLAAPGVALLTARPLEAEATLAFAGLTDLLSDVPVEAYDALPPPQRRALRAALLLEAVSDDIDPRAVGAGLRGVLLRLSEDGRVVLVIDDAHWLDEASAVALGQALRRLAPGRVVVIAAARPEGVPVDAWLPEAADALALRLAPLGAAALFHIIRDRLAITVDRGRLREIERVSGGNPLYALELARAKGSAGFDELLGARIRALRRETRVALLTAALSAGPTLERLGAALGESPQAVVERLDEAMQAGLVSLGDEVRFEHPLYAELVVAGAAQPDVLACHARLSEVEESPEARARHLGLATTDPDPALAQALEDAARSTYRRGGWDAAIELLQLAVERSPSSIPDLPARTATLGSWLANAGRPVEAERWLRATRERAAGDAYWHATLGLARLTAFDSRYDEAQALLVEVAGPDAPVEFRAQALLEEFFCNREAPVVAQTLLERLPHSPEVERLRLRARVAEGWALINVGLPVHDLAAEALAREAEIPPSSSWASAHFLAWRDAMCGDDFETARQHSARLSAIAQDLGEDSALPAHQMIAAGLETRAGNWGEAARLFGLAATGEGGGLARLLTARLGLIELRGLTGDIDGGLAEIDQWESDTRHLSEFYRCRAPLVRAGVLLAAERPDEAFATLSGAFDEFPRLSTCDPGDLPAWSLLVSAAVQTGRLGEARAALEAAEQRCRVAERPNMMLLCDLLWIRLTAAEGNLTGAAAALPDLVQRLESTPIAPLRKGICYLDAGRIHRRAKQKRLAHESLTRAVELFDALPCPPYAAQARAELGRVGLRPGAPDTLTESERRVAELAAAGLRNKEIAEKAYLSAKTVEAVLGRVYRKLGIRSRAELARALEAAAD